MKCYVCDKELNFLYFVGKDNVCNKCIAKHTVFKEVKVSEDILLRKALRSFEIKGFEDLKNISYADVDKLAHGQIKEKSKQTVKFKKNKVSAVSVDDGDYLDPQTELDMSY
ncbi:hypothetical protein HN789_05495 [archaeon]|jgi:hypothetical protein|nr:hypothetical protein [archaeon]MBT4022967.1 hypothetical protein [archaeon]MBT4271958.1 hypothetical protein [archaeon]MBT4461796.1 hypothetical protein [archaeon]MBT4858189.1 hypothetical protein [archaeon]